MSYIVQPVTRSEVSVALQDISGSQIVIGDHNTVQTPKGTRVTIVETGERPRPQLRTLPLAHRPVLHAEVIGREAELAQVASASPGSPVQLFGEEGIGKTSLLKLIAQEAPGLREGVVFESVRRRTLDEILAALYEACFDCDVPFVPTPQQVGGFLVDREVLVVLDDCGVDRSDLDVLLDKLPRSSFMLSNCVQTLWHHGTARQVEGLSEEAGMRLLEHELGGLADDERDAARSIVRRRKGSPQKLLEAAAQVVHGPVTLRDIAADGSTELPGSDDLPESGRRVVALLDQLDGAALGARRVAAILDIPESELASLVKRGWLKTASPSLRLARPAVSTDPEVGNALADRLVEHLTTFAKRAPGAAVAAESEAIVATLALAAGRERWKDVLALARAAEVKLAPTGTLVTWQRVLHYGLDAARALSDADAEAHMLHQLGSLDVCLGAHDDARDQLERALHIRESLNDEQGVLVTSHNLHQLDRSLPGPPSSWQRFHEWLKPHWEFQGGPLDWFPKPLIFPWPWLVVVLAAAAVAAAALIFGGSGPTHR